MFRLLLCTALLAAPAWAQTPDFGTDQSPWSNDGECDDPRFQGPGMTATRLLASDIRADAGDCRAAFDSGRVTLIGDALPPGKGTPLPSATQPAAPGATAAAINFGDDTGDWPNDGECDDRRFAGAGMASVLSWSQTGRDADDCRTLQAAGAISLWVQADAMAATDCAAIGFGDNSGEFAFNGECDDGRFEGPGAASTIGDEFINRDAADCRQLCSFGVLARRDY